MLKTHEKSRIRPVCGTRSVKAIEDIIIQLEITGQISDGHMIYLVETVSPADYDRETAEGRALDAQKRLQDEIANHEGEMDAAKAQIAALEEMLEQVRDERDKAREDARRSKEKNVAFYGALIECERIFGSLPPEIERLYKGEAERGYK